MELILTNDINEVKRLVKDGFCPVECSIGGESIVDEFVMDHHGKYHNLESVALRAYVSFFGERKNDQRFVVVGNPDADACFAIASLAGILPHPSKQVNHKLPQRVKDRLQKDWMALAKTIARVDTSPIGLNIPEMPYGDILLTWNAMAQGRDSLALQQGVGLWRTLLEADQSRMKPFFDACAESEKTRIDASIRDLVERSKLLDGILLIEGSRVFGWPEWYGRTENNPTEKKAGWKHPIVVAWQESSKAISIGCPNNDVAEDLFGLGGLLNVWPKLEPAGFGGHKAIGGSPRGMKMDLEHVQNVVLKLQEILNRN